MNTTPRSWRMTFIMRQCFKDEVVCFIYCVFVFMSECNFSPWTASPGGGFGGILEAVKCQLETYKSLAGQSRHYPTIGRR